jgi:hypothetical protein
MRKELTKGNHAWQLDSYQGREKTEDMVDSIRRERLESMLSFFLIFAYKSCLVRTCVKGLGL